MSSINKIWRSNDFDYHLPENLIAQSPVKQRQNSRLLVVAGQLFDRYFYQLSDYLQAGDLLVLNDTRVLKARFFGHKIKATSSAKSEITEQVGGKVEVFIQKIIKPHMAIAMVRASKPPALKSFIRLGEHILLQIVARDQQFYQLALYETPPEINDFWQLCQAFGQLPLPPYIARDKQQLSDEEDYQTVYAKEIGAVAAPTAGLHFDQTLLEQLHTKGVKSAFITLHVGAGTFMPLRSDLLSEHQMHSESYLIPQVTVEQIKRCKHNGGRIVAVGTTSLRALESAYIQAMKIANLAKDTTSEVDISLIAEMWQDTDLFIYPGYQFAIVDTLITNFHLPKSTLLALVSAFAGYQNIRTAYEHAIEQKYRFFSYGDAMLLQKNSNLI